MNTVIITILVILVLFVVAAFFLGGTAGICAVGGWHASSTSVRHQQRDQKPTSHSETRPSAARQAARKTGGVDRLADRNAARPSANLLLPGGRRRAVARPARAGRPRQHLDDGGVLPGCEYFGRREGARGVVRIALVLNEKYGSPAKLASSGAWATAFHVLTEKPGRWCVECCSCWWRVESDHPHSSKPEL